MNGFIKESDYAQFCTTQFIKLLKDELTDFLGKDAEQINFSKKAPTIILVAGLQGSGKTTTCVKLANFLKNKHNKNYSNQNIRT